MESKKHIHSLLDPALILNRIELPVIDGPFPHTPVMLAKLSCGLFGISDDLIEKYQSLDSLFIKNRYNTFFFEAAGDSMEPTIYQGQVLIVDRARKDFNGRVCAVEYEDKIICKRVLIKNDAIILRSDNQKYKDILVYNNESVNFWGIVIANAGYVK
ncbi:MAG: S24 family peptidase [Rhizobacter sp.]|nr:S24 family peptidase [Bacteriovorax sp.]